MATEMLQPQTIQRGSSSCLNNNGLSLINDAPKMNMDDLVQRIPGDKGTKRSLTCRVVPLSPKIIEGRSSGNKGPCAGESLSYQAPLKDYSQGDEKSSSSDSLRVAKPTLKCLSSDDSTSDENPEVKGELKESPVWKNVEATPKISRVPKLLSTCLQTSGTVDVESKRADRSRSQSTPVGGSRRTIFGSFWKKEDSVNGEDDNQSLNSTRSASSSRSTTRNHRRFRSNSTVLSDLPGSSRGNLDIMMFAPPLEYSSALIDHFERLETLPLSARQSLPPLPTPLRRIQTNFDGTSNSGGMYPLYSERPVLHKSSYGPVTLEEHERQKFQEIKDAQTPTKVAYFASPLPLNLTDSIRPQHKRSTNSHRTPLDQTGKIHTGVTSQIIQDNILELSSTASSSSTSQSSRRVIRFDPRITVTEFDDHIARQWYSESELELLKLETIELVQRYLLQNPHLAAEYCIGTYDPVTGSTRKKTLYSLPILNCTDEEIATTAMSSPPQGVYNYSKMANIHVRKVLVIDPNTLILDLFCKSLRQMFPNADVTTAQTGEEALYHIKEAFKTGMSHPPIPRGFDIVIVEERLQTLPLRGHEHSPLQLCTTDASPPKGKHKKSFSESSSVHFQTTQHSSMSCLSDYYKTSSCPSSMHQTLLSGSDVVNRILQLEEELFRPDRCILEDDEFHEDSPRDDNTCGSEEQPHAQEVCWRSLLIGVCVDQQYDAKRLKQSGADIVWGKPPPHMGEILRNQLIHLLVSKRNPGRAAP